MGAPSQSYPVIADAFSLSSAEGVVRGSACLRLFFFPRALRDWYEAVGEYTKYGYTYVGGQEKNYWLWRGGTH